MIPESFHFLTGPIRDDARQVHLYNEGLVTFFYDPARLDRIVSSGAAILEYFDRSVLDDERLDALFADGTLVIEILDGDGAVDLDVVLGDDLTEEEKARGPWLAPESGRIVLPSGRLRIDTYNSLPFGDGADRDGATVDAPAGEYRLTIHRKDWMAVDEEWFLDAEDAGIDAFGDDRIDAVVVLTPLPEGRARPARGVLHGGGPG